MHTHEADTIWSVSEAKSRLSEVLRRARQNGPQFVGKREQCVIISQQEWEARVEQQENMSLWLLRHSPEIYLKPPGRGQSTGRTNPFEES